MGFCVCSMFCCTLLYGLFRFAICVMGKREHIVKLGVFHANQISMCLEGEVGTVKPV